MSESAAPQSSGPTVECIDLTASPDVAPVRTGRHRSQSASSNGDIIVVGEIKRKKPAVIVIDSPKSRSGSAQKKGNKRKREEASTSVAVVPPPNPEPPKPATVFKCPICLDTNAELMEKNVNLLVPPCGHLLCKPCSQSLPPECPVCRKKYKKNSLRPLFL
ncbi:E3 ubiquitin-protein ligase RNF4-like isoform X2 [Paramacrobiotus metropolitanus]|uniref:E3 ubiquitin-protein ligase RNF4-like isoform X2 n=1 Tax=Paramacrobiotus metropolitanus TaxID=2943436 RepID=UPI002445A45E|nr:E3 ubiquitin-protein ligase RNF4-like isoform X2 [Paramacrobiotus metropolitanus]